MWVRVGFDLDGVLVDGPPFVPSWLLELLYRGTKGKKLHYRIPSSKIEIWIRQLSHNSFFRPPVLKNIEILKQMTGNELFLITSRFSFLQKRTMNLLKLYGIDHLFKEIVLNSNDDQPHLFKLRTLERLKLDLFIDDDEDLLTFLKEKLPNTKFVTAPSK